MKEVICGAGGFLGSNLRKHLEDKGKKVVVMPTEKLLDPPGMHVFLKENEPYHFYYLAVYGNLHHQTDTQQVYRVIINKFLNVLEATQGTKMEAMVTAGSTSEYGDKPIPMTEDMLLEPETFYGAAKAGATHLAQVWARVFGQPVVVFRPSSITGVGEQPMHLIPTLIRSCMQGEKMPFIGEPTHDYVNVKDVVSALEILSEKAKDHQGEIFNIGTGVETSNLIIKEMVEHITDHQANIDKNNRPDPKTITRNFSQVWVADSTKMKELGWEPEFTLYDTLKEMVRMV